MEETNKDPNFMAQADIDKKLEEKFKAANQKLEEIQKVLYYEQNLPLMYAMIYCAGRMQCMFNLQIARYA